MAKKRTGAGQDQSLAGAAMLRRVFPLLARLAASGTQRDKAHNRRLLFSQYAGLVLVGLFNPVLQSARALVAASGLKQVRRLTGGGQTSLGAFSEATSVFEPALLEGLIHELRSAVHRRRHLDRVNTRGRPGELPDRLVERLIAADASVLTALPQVVGRWGATRPGQWRLHAQVHVCDNVLVAARLTPEPAVAEHAEREVLARSLPATDSPLQRGLGAGRARTVARRRWFGALGVARTADRASSRRSAPSPGELAGLPRRTSGPSR
jgi:hypothetical protein